MSPLPTLLALLLGISGCADKQERCNNAKLEAVSAWGTVADNWLTLAFSVDPSGRGAAAGPDGVSANDFQQYSRLGFAVRSDLLRGDILGAKSGSDALRKSVSIFPVLGSPFDRYDLETRKTVTVNPMDLMDEAWSACNGLK